ncbi:MAG TPA: HAD-IA family hydrolase [Candidatus Brocadiia bacterium]|nr:HAD-IA family hydrolase [Candidatus Brocadiia bacterium]
MRYQAIIFDLDGTLIDTRRDLTEAINHARKVLGLAPLAIEKVVKCVGDGMTLLLRRVMDGDHQLAEAARPHFMDHYGANLVTHTTLYPGVQEGLRRLADLGVRMAVLTNKPERFSRAILEHFKLAPLFVGIVGGDTHPTRKPDPQGALALLKRMRPQPAQTLMAGDNHTDLITAQRAGMDSVYCAYGFGHHAEAGYTHEAACFMDIVDIVADGSQPQQPPTLNSPHSSAAPR